MIKKSEKITENSSERLRSVLDSLAEFDRISMDIIVSCFKTKTVKRHALLLNEGEVCSSFYFVYKGCIRTYFLDRKGYEKTRLLIPDCSIGTALTSFITRDPSIEFIEALEDSELLVISHHDFFCLVKEYDQWQQFYQSMLEWAYAYQNRKIEGLVTLTASQRYQRLMDENPSLILRLSNSVLASYLDIKPETLSRLKSK